MLFTNGIYFVFLIAAFFVYWMIAARVGWRIMFLALASCFIYWQGAGRALLLLVAVSLIDYSTTRLMARSENKRRRRLLLRVSLAIDIGALCVFKYANFFIESFTNTASLFGISISPAHFNIIAPIGISFFIFQSIAYVIDVYRSDVEPAESYMDYLAFVSFFPTIIAGPILRARQLLPQLRKRVTLDSVMGGQALFLISIGLPDVSIMLAGPMDRGARGAGGKIITRPMIPKLVSYQRRIAAETGCAFFDTFTAMGGEGTLIYDAMISAYEEYKQKGTGIRGRGPNKTE